jgi:hypothetical protein
MPTTGLRRESPPRSPLTDPVTRVVHRHRTSAAARTRHRPGSDVRDLWPSLALRANRSRGCCYRPDGGHTGRRPCVELFRRIVDTRFPMDPVVSARSPTAVSARERTSRWEPSARSDRSCLAVCIPPPPGSDRSDTGHQHPPERERADLMVRDGSDPDAQELRLDRREQRARLRRRYRGQEQGRHTRACSSVRNV